MYSRVEANMTYQTIHGIGFLGTNVIADERIDREIVLFKLYLTLWTAVKILV